MLDQLDNPQNKVKTIHVTGTNGKGSTCYYLSHLLTAANQKVGLFISPFIIQFNERIQINNQPISDNELVKLVEIVKSVLDKIRNQQPDFIITEFEFVTVLGYLAFANHQVDYAIIEVGIGGKNDKTNVITPELSIITSIGMDHKALIGPTLRDIAKEKAGIIKAHKPVVIGHVSKEVKSVIQNRITKIKACGYWLDYQFEIEQQSFKTQNRHYIDVKPAAYVEQIDMAIATQAYELLLPYQLDSVKVVDVLNSVEIPARYQFVNEKPDIIVDGAHNIDAIKELKNYLVTHYPDSKKLTILTAIMKDKDYRGIFNLLKDYKIKLTTIDNPRAVKKSEFEELNFPNLTYVEDYLSFIQHWRQQSDSSDTLVICGSFYFASEVIKFF
ncbi:bifunctional folylpolyglutamate synthase/dihydrofolate synthase [Holzapfeliella floricola]|uniref:bifunctional folylpolyglutamate synthase/dihydrofolate synthase n=1 Tax=Holzapfeliella floricola TaxID=679249 RepID=UPI0007838DA5|nr:folylpolyglutamate synthase/dihydrofolate synthase family protein [Holzapfeliella floricola]